SIVPAAAAGDADPRRADRIRQHGRGHLVTSIRGAGEVRAAGGRPPAAAGVLRTRTGPVAPTTASRARTTQRAAPTGGEGAEAPSGPTGHQRRNRRAAAVFAGHLGRGQAGVGAPAGAGRYCRSDPPWPA